MHTHTRITSAGNSQDMEMFDFHGEAICKFGLIFHWTMFVSGRIPPTNLYIGCPVDIPTCHVKGSAAVVFLIIYCALHPAFHLLFILSCILTIKRLWEVDDDCPFAHFSHRFLLPSLGLSLAFWDPRIRQLIVIYLQKNAQNWIPKWGISSIF